jgi:hypothetical protein
LLKTGLVQRVPSVRWVHSIEGAEAALDGKSHAIHVMDREADSYAILSVLEKLKSSFVICTGSA